LSFSSDAPAPSRLSPLPLHDALPICGFLSDPSTVKHCALPRISRCGSGTARASLLLGPSSLRQRVDGANVTRVTGVRMFEILPSPSLEVVLIAARAMLLTGAFWVFTLAFIRWRRADERSNTQLHAQLDRAFNEIRSLRETVAVMSARIEALS